MTGQMLLDFLLKQSEESLAMDLSLLDEFKGEFFTVERVYLHDEKDKQYGNILDQDSIVLTIDTQ